MLYFHCDYNLRLFLGEPLKILYIVSAFLCISGAACIAKSENILAWLDPNASSVVVTVVETAANNGTVPFLQSKTSG